MKTYTHKLTGWTRTALGDMSGSYRIVPTDGSGERIVRFLSAHSWANDPNDDPARQSEDRIVLLSGSKLPEWAIGWLSQVNAKSCRNGRNALQAAIADADFTNDRRDADFY